MVFLLTETIINIMSNFVPNKVITIRNKDAVWMTAEIKRTLLVKSKVYEQYVKNGRRKEDLKNLQEHQSRCRRAVRDAKESYFSRLANNLNDPNLGSKKYWSILNQFLHRRKSPRIPPVRDSSNNLIADVATKTNIFNQFF
eukprot:TCONS_00069027-protein